MHQPPTELESLQSTPLAPGRLGRAGPCAETAPFSRIGRVLTIGVVVLGTTDGPRATEFWRQALGYVLRTDGFGGWKNVLEPPEGGPGVRVALQRSQAQPQDQPRIHLDLHVADAAEQQAEVARLVAIGAERVAWDSYPDDPDFVVLADPDGNRFCVVDLSHEQKEEELPPGPAS
jgi:catechol 2,3-dioxygenase-like lactoylglutathione lyase family enzyme